jgi:iron complex transport system substrate-binding protein
MLPLVPVQQTVAQDDGTDTQLPITLVDATGTEVTIESLDSIVSGSGDVSEIIWALGYADNLVGIDISSTYPEWLMEEYPEIGFARRLTIEPIVALNPTVFFCSLTCSPTSVIEQLRDLGIPVVIVPDIVPDHDEDYGLELPLAKVDMVAKALGVPERSEQLKDRIEREIQWARTAVANVEEKPYAFFLYLRGRGLQLVGGEGVPGAVMIEGAGAIDAGVDIGVQGYQSLSPEVLLSAYPDYFILFQGSVDSFGGLDAVREIPGVAQTPAGENNNFIVMDDQFILGMSTRTGQALLELAAQLHPSMTWELEIEYPYMVTDATGTEITVENPASVVVPDDALRDIVQKLGFHAARFDELEENSLVVATQQDEWQMWRDEGYTVLVVEDSLAVGNIAALLHVPGRGEALLARLEQE